MENAVERIIGIALLVVCLSHLLRPREWAEFFAQLQAKGAPGAFIYGMMSLSFGALIVGFHGTQWSGWSAAATFIGWAQVVKGAIHLCFPAYSLRSMGRVPPENYRRFAIAGAVGAPLAAAMFIASFR
ncbi:MAG TPA: hypothetical protein VGN73_14520 [Gemmatimonadaceae bacterium]|jgi:hypothetical protein|nr:hypothetical protein [Gemmatimonadaceae bacterium]